MGLFGRLFGDAKARQKKEWENKLVAINERLRYTHDKIDEAKCSLEKIGYYLERKIAEIDAASNIRTEPWGLKSMVEDMEILQRRFDALNAVHRILMTQKVTVETLLAAANAPDSVDIRAESELLERKYLELEIALEPKLEEAERIANIRLSTSANDAQDELAALLASRVA